MLPLVLALSLASEAEEGAVLRGRVVERGSGAAVPATVTVDGAPVDVDATGRFEARLPEGVVRVVIASPDHRAVEEELALSGLVERTWWLERYAWGSEITVYGEKEEEVARAVVSADELRQIPGSFGDPVRALQALPGVARPQTVEGDIVVRGAEGLNTAVHIDDVPVPYLFHFFVGRSVVNGALIDDVEFLPGALPPRWGHATQAIVNARTSREHPKPGLHGRVSADLLDVAASAEAPLGEELSFLASTRWSWVGGFVGAGSRVVSWARGQRGYAPGWISPAYLDGTARLAWQRGPDRVALTVFGTRDALILHPPRFDEDGDGRLDPPELEEGLPYDPGRLMDSGFLKVQARWDRAVGGRTQSTWIAVGPEREHALLEGIGQLSNGPQFGKTQGFTAIARREDRVPLGDHDVIRAGAELRGRSARVEDYSEAFVTGETEVWRDTPASAGVFAEWQHEAGRLWVAPGVRLSAYAFDGKVVGEPEPRASARLRLDDRWTATAFVGRMTQLPPPHHYSAALGTPGLGPMSAWQASIGAEGRLDSGLSLDLTAWGTRMDDLVVREPEVVVKNLYGDHAHTVIEPVYKGVDGWAFGLEAFARMRPKNGWFGWVAASTSRALRVDEGALFPGNQDEPFAVTVLGAKELPRDWRLSGKFRLTAGHPFTPEHGVFDPIEDAWTGYLGARNAARFPPFHQLDLRVDKTWTAKRARWTAYLDVYNATNARNYLLATYTPNYARLTPVVWIPILPTAGLEVAF